MYATRRFVTGLSLVVHCSPFECGILFNANIILTCAKLLTFFLDFSFILFQARRASISYSSDLQVLQKRRCRHILFVNVLSTRDCCFFCRCREIERARDDRDHVIEGKNHASL